MEYPHLFADRSEAGKLLADELVTLQLTDPLVLALPRGGVPVAKEIALKLNASLDVLVVRKIGSPSSKEYGIGAMSEDFKPLFSNSTLLSESYFADDIKEVIEDEKWELKRRISQYRGHRTLPRILGRTVILVDDGISTGVTAAAAAKYVRSMGPEKVIIASPVCPRENDPWLEKYADRVFCLQRPPSFSGVGQWYINFNPVTDQEVLSTLKQFHTTEEDRRQSL
jgi:putative phosphoribosyl transferase